MPESSRLSSSYLLGILLLAFISFCFVYYYFQNDQKASELSKDYTVSRHLAFVGDQHCQSCHASEWESWKDSHHYLAMAKASGESVRGDFDDVTFTKGSETYRFYRDGVRYMVDAPGPDGINRAYEITYTFGWEPLQQYLVDFGKGKLQALHISWDTEREEWFTLYKDEEILPGEWLHWTGGAMNWNTMCADCHSTNLRQNYFADADSFDTQWSDISVSCEACHGPGLDHVTFMESEESEAATSERIRRDLKLTRGSTQTEEINSCAPCHSLRQGLTGEYIHGDKFLDHYDPQLPHPHFYHPDGQLLEEAFEYSSFLQSRMYKEGVRCTDCHDPHTARLKANVIDNSLCMQCHAPTYNTIEHHFHEINTVESQCISCHMPGQYYMEVDLRRDHSFRVPRPDLSLEFGTPNACNDCHSDRSAEWAAKSVENWYGELREFHFSETLLKANSSVPGVAKELQALIADAGQPDIARATAIWFLGRLPDLYNDENNLNTLKAALNSGSALMRNSAVKVLEYYSSDIRKPLLTSSVGDSIRTVRLSAVRGLSELAPDDFPTEQQNQFKSALIEYRHYLDFNQYFPHGQMNRALFYEKKGEIDKAKEAYLLVLDKDPMFNAARINLAFIFNRLGQNQRAIEMLQIVNEQEPDYGDAYYSIALILAEENNFQDAIVYFEKAANRMPDNGRVYYNWALALQTLKQHNEAEKLYLMALDIEPDHGDYRYGIVTLYIQQEKFEQALEHALILDSRYPGNPQIHQLIQFLRMKLQ